MRFEVMLKSAKMVILLAIVAGQVFVPLSLHAAVPAFLPDCGHNRLPGSVNSGAPDIDISGENYYTAATWAEGSDGVGPVRLTYSNIFTSTHLWNSQAVPAALQASDFSDASIDFSPTVSNTISAAYKYTLNTSVGGIAYMQCPLGGTCTQSSAKLGTTTVNDQNPQIAAAPAGVVIVYDNNVDGKIRYIYMTGGVVGNAVVVDPGINGKHPAIVYNNNKMHIVYADAGGAINYFSINVASFPPPAASSPVALYSSKSGALARADYPSIAAVDNTLMAVWDFEYIGGGAAQSDTTKFVLAQALSIDNGASWNTLAGANGGAARTIPTHAAVSAFTDNVSDNDDIWSSKFTGTDGSSNPNFSRLRPDVSLHKAGSTIYAHVVWQAEIGKLGDPVIFTPGYGNRSQAGHDILYAYTSLSSITWKGVPLGDTSNPNGRAGVAPKTTHGITDLTVEYFDDEQQNGSGGRDSALPQAVFIGNNTTAGQASNRLQLVYRSQAPDNSWDARYNGFELGPNNLIATPDQSKQDTDCDSYMDPVEFAAPSPTDDCTPAPLFGGANDYGEWNCDQGADYVPDYLDTNSDNDFLSDFFDANWRSFSTDGGVFLPVVIKS